MRNYTFNSSQGIIRNWWLSLLIGILLIILSLLFLFRPFNTWETLKIVLVAGFFITGLSEIIFLQCNKNNPGWMLTGAIFDISLAILLLNIPETTSMVMVYAVGSWIMFHSMWAIEMSVELLGRGIKGCGGLFFFAILSNLFSFIFITYSIQASGFAAIMAVVAFIVYGIFRIYLSLQMKLLTNKNIAL